VWYDSLNNYYLAVDTYKNADESTITENSNGEFTVADVNTGTIVADTGVFANNVKQGFLAFIAAVVAKINGLFSLTSGLNTAVGLKYTKPSGGIPTSDMALTDAQLNAVNSGITAALVTTFSGKQGALTTDQLNAVNSGITAALVATFGGKQGALTTDQLAAVNSGITAALVANIGGKQAALTTDQLAAVNSGITSALVTTFSGKQGALTTDQLNAVNSGITAALVTTFSGKQGALTTDQLAAVNSGITAALVANIGYPDKTAAGEAAALALSTANPTAIVWYPEGVE
jgi:hypothetical protein